MLSPKFSTVSHCSNCLTRCKNNFGVLGNITGAEKNVKIKINTAVEGETCYHKIISMYKEQKSRKTGNVAIQGNSYDDDGKYWDFVK